MNTDRHETLIADYLDDLLDDAERVEAEAVIAEHPQLVARVARRHALLYRPYPVAPAPAGLAARAVVASAAPSRNPWARYARYAAMFVAGVLTTWMVSAAQPDEPTVPHVKTPHESTPPSVIPSDDETDLDVEPESPARRDVVFLRRRIR